MADGSKFWAGDVLLPDGTTLDDKLTIERGHNSEETRFWEFYSDGTCKE